MAGWPTIFRKSGLEAAQPRHDQRRAQWHCALFKSSQYALSRGCIEQGATGGMGPVACRALVVSRSCAGGGMGLQLCGCKFWSKSNICQAQYAVNDE